MKTLASFISMLLTLSSMAANAQPAFDGACYIFTTGKSPSEIHPLKSQAVSLLPGDNLVLYRSNKATIRFSVVKIEDQEKTFLELSIVSTKGQTLASSIVESTGSTPSISLVAPNVSDFSGPALLEVTCRQSK